MYLSRWLGFFCIICGCSGLGIWYSMQMKQKVWHLREMVRILELAISEIDYGKSTLPECCLEIGERAPQPYGKLFQKIYDGFQEAYGLNLGSMSKQILEKGLADIPVEEEKEVFIRCFSDVGFTDEWLQKRNMERGRDVLLGRIEAEEIDLKKRSRLAVSLGTMSGLLLVLILL